MPELIYLTSNQTLTIYLEGRSEATEELFGMINGIVLTAIRSSSRQEPQDQGREKQMETMASCLDFLFLQNNSQSLPVCSKISAG